MLAVQPNERRANILPPGGILRSGALALLQDAPADGVVADRSGAGNNMVLASGRAVIADGITDRINLPALGTITSVVLLFKHTSTITVRFRLASGAPLSLSYTTAGAWQELTWTGSVGASAPTLFWDGSTYNAGTMAHVRFYNGTSLVARYYLNSHASGDLNTLPALDSSGNGNHGTFVGCDGLTGIGIPAEVRGLGGYENYMWFSGTGTHILFPAIGLNSANSLDVEFTVFCTRTPSSVVIPFSHVSGTAFSLMWESLSLVRLNVGGSTLGVTSLTFSATFPLNKLCQMRFEYRPNTANWVKIYVDGALIGQSTTSLSAPVFTSLTSSRFGFNTGDGITHFQGFIAGYKINGTLIAEGNGVTSAAWGGGTVSGSPRTIGQLRYMPVPQTAAMDWNKDGAMLVPQTPNGLDAQGNAISRPRPHPAFLNFPEQGESGVITTVPGARTFSFWCYWDGSTAKKLIDLGTPEINVTSGGVVSTTGITSPTLYVDGVASTALTVGYHQIAVTSATAFDCTPVTATVQSGDHLFYSTVLTASQITQNFRSTRSKYA